MSGSGFSDVLLEAGMITTGSMTGVMNGKNYSRALNCQKTLTEAIFRLLFNRFIEEQEFSNNLKLLAEGFLHNVNKDSWKLFVGQPDVEDLVRQFNDFSQSTELGKTAEFWIQHTNHVNLCLTLIKAVKTNNYLYRYCLIQMCDLFFAYNGQNYARYLTFFSVYILNAGAEELLKRGALSVARSFIPGNRCVVDKKIEETFMKHAKSRGVCRGVGISGISNNPEAYQRWARTKHQRSQFLAKTLAIAQ